MRRDIIYHSFEGKVLGMTNQTPAWEERLSRVFPAAHGALGFENVKGLITDLLAEEYKRGREDAVEYITRIAWEGAAPDTKLVNKSILEAAKNPSL